LAKLEADGWSVYIAAWSEGPQKWQVILRKRIA